MALPQEQRDWRKMREQRGWTLTELARRAGINKGTLSAIETRRTVPMPFEAAAILRALTEEEQR